MTSERVIQKLFDFSVSLFRSVVASRRASRLPDDDGWTEEKDRLIIWGDGFNISEGELDEVLSTKNAQHLRRSVEILLSSLSGSLLKLLDGAQRESKLAVLKDIAQHVEPVAAELLSCEISTDGSVVWDGPKPTLEDLINLNDSLYWLMPFLEEIAEQSSIVKTEGLTWVPSEVASAARDSNIPDSVSSTSNQELRDSVFEDLQPGGSDRGSAQPIPNEQVTSSLINDSRHPDLVQHERDYYQPLNFEEMELFGTVDEDHVSERHSIHSACSVHSIRSIKSTYSTRTGFRRSSTPSIYSNNTTHSSSEPLTLSTDNIDQVQVHRLPIAGPMGEASWVPTNECFFSFTGCNERLDVAHWVPHAEEHVRSQGIEQEPGPLECSICGVRVKEGTWASVFFHAFFHWRHCGPVRRDPVLLDFLVENKIITLVQLDCVLGLAPVRSVKI
ncbi:hypothetical protein K440DRAFT_678323 [Wilcoxina mikolae CBS 423.85]|nr:hypothetical protein K440DRAFT_678323 [Wilcoxina mikolae CBS 423.85]